MPVLTLSSYGIYSTEIQSGSWRRADRNLIVMGTNNLAEAEE